MYVFKNTSIPTSTNKNGSIERYVFKNTPIPTSTSTKKNESIERYAPGEKDNKKAAQKQFAKIVKKNTELVTLVGNHLANKKLNNFKDGLKGTLRKMTPTTKIKGDGLKKILKKTAKYTAKVFL